MLDAFLSGFAKGAIHKLGEKAGEKSVEKAFDIVSNSSNHPCNKVELSYGVEVELFHDQYDEVPDDVAREFKKLPRIL